MYRSHQGVERPPKTRKKFFFSSGGLVDYQYLVDVGLSVVVLLTE